MNQVEKKPTKRTAKRSVAFRYLDQVVEAKALEVYGAFRLTPPTKKTGIKTEIKRVQTRKVAEA